MLVAVVFVKGCPWRCHYCHNPHLQSRDRIGKKNEHILSNVKSYLWSDFFRFLNSRKGLLDGVVFSGGEPFSEPGCNEMIDQVKSLGFKVGVHTAGIYPDKISQVINQLDWVGLDIKTLDSAYDELTGRKNSSRPVWRSLEILLEADTDFECRTTWSPRWLEESALIDLAQYLSRQGVRKYAIQRFRSATDRQVGAELSAPTLASIGTLFEQFSYR